MLSNDNNSLFSQVFFSDLFEKRNRMERKKDKEMKEKKDQRQTNLSWNSKPEIKGKGNKKKRNAGKKIIPNNLLIKRTRARYSSVVES